MSKRNTPLTLKLSPPSTIETFPQDLTFHVGDIRPFNVPHSPLQPRPRFAKTPFTQDLRILSDGIHYQGYEAPGTLLSSTLSLSPTCEGRFNQYLVLESGLIPYHEFKSLHTTTLAPSSPTSRQSLDLLTSTPDSFPSLPHSPSSPPPYSPPPVLPNRRSRSLHNLSSEECCYIFVIIFVLIKVFLVCKFLDSMFQDEWGLL